METKKTKRKLDLHTIEVGGTKTFAVTGNPLTFQSSLCVSGKNVAKKVEGFKIKTSLNEDKTEITVTRIS